MQPRDLSDLSPYVPGRGTEEVARDLGMDPDDLTKLSSNENPHGPSPAAVEAIRKAAPTVNVYPKASHTDLGEAVADRWGVTPERVWIAPGADGAIDYLSRAFLDPGDRMLVSDPGFSYYPMSARYHHGDVASYPVRKAEDFAQTAPTVLDAYDGERLVYLTTPHNPSGAEFSREAIVEVADSVAPDTLVVVDEAYGAYTEAPSSIELTDEHDNIAVLRTFSKAYGLAGLRIGYAIVPGAWADAYARVNTPFAANEVACRAALAALDDDDHLERTVETARWARDHLRDNLDAPTWESGGNFVLAEVGDAPAVAEATKRRGVIVRDCTSFGLPDCIRVSCGTRDGTRRAVEVINDVLVEVRM
ncbi:MAG: histidinol-phosphate transaminase [Haloplanus sp.]